MSVTLYTSKTCAYCPMVARYLTMKGIEFEEKDGTTVDNMREIMKFTSDKLFPTLIVEDGDNVRVVSGYNLSKVATAIKA